MARRATIRLVWNAGVVQSGCPLDSPVLVLLRLGGMRMEKVKAEAKKWERPLETAALASKEERRGEAERKEEVYAKTFQWIDQHAGNCHLSGILTIYSNGHAHWDATTWTDSTHNKDVWHETLRVYDAQNRELFGFGVWDSPKMDSPPNGGQYHWTNEGGFPKEFWAPAVTAVSEGSC